MSRTRLLTAAAVAGALTVTAACSGGGTAGPKAADVKLRATTAPAKGALTNVSWMVDEEPDSLDLDTQGTVSGDTILANVCEKLMRTTPQLTVEPNLAAKVAQPDAKTVVFTLRDDATFHDGSAMTADDVVWSLKRHAKPGADESDEYETVKSIEKTGAHEVTVRMSEPNALFVRALAGDAGIVYNRKVAEAQGKDFGTPGHPDACGGPYRLSSWSAGSQIVIDRYDRYWNPKLKPLTKRVTFRWADDNALVNSLTTGQGQGAYLDAPASAVPLSRGGKVKLAYGASTTVWSLMPTARGGATDPGIRRALSLAVDRAGIAKAGFGGLATPWKTPVGPGSWGYAQPTFQAAYAKLGGAPARPDAASLKRAKALVARAGPQKKPLVVASDGARDRTVIANAVVDAARKIGLKAQVKTIPTSQFASFYTDEKLRGSVDLVPDNYYIFKNDPMGFYDNGLTGSENNWSGFSDKGYDKLVHKALATTDDAKRAVLAIQVEARWNADMVWVPLLQVPSILAMDGKLTGPSPSMSYLSYPWAAYLGAKAGS